MKKLTHLYKKIKKIIALLIIMLILIIIGLFKFGISPITSIRYIRESYNYVFHGIPFIETDVDK